MTHRVVIDTNILVAADFNPDSHAAQIIERVRSGSLDLIWHQKTKAEYHRIINQIPPLSWSNFEDLFTSNNEFKNDIMSGNFQFIVDPDDRKFAALAAGSNAVLISNDQHLLASREKLGIITLTSSEFIKGYTNDHS